MWATFQIVRRRRPPGMPPGRNATPWFHGIDFADGRRFLQFRITLFGNPWTGAVPSVESIVVPIR